MKSTSKCLPESIPLVVCERTGDWAEAFRRAAACLTRQPISISETRSVTQCSRRLAERRSTSAGIPLVVELTTATAVDVCELLAWHLRRFGNAPRMVVAVSEAADYEELVREAGASSFVTSPRECGSCVVEYLRFRDDPSHVPVDDVRTLVERVRDSLPWRAVRESSESAET